jgi:hypothetical protein
MNIDKFCHAIEKIGDIFKQYFVWKQSSTKYIIDSIKW